MAGSSAHTLEQSLTDREPVSSLSVSVSGAGPTGALLALGLAALGCNVALSDPLSKDQIASRSRAYAITHSSKRLLQRLELWSELQPTWFLSPGCALRIKPFLLWFGSISMTWPLSIGALGPLVGSLITSL